MLPQGVLGLCSGLATSREQARLRGRGHSQLASGAHLGPLTKPRLAVGVDGGGRHGKIGFNLAVNKGAIQGPP